MLPVPSSPVAVNLTPSLVQAMPTVFMFSLTVAKKKIKKIKKHTRVADDGEVAADALELGRGHLDDGIVVGLRDAEVFAVDVEELELIVGHTLAV